jgi:hypothetical protein
MAEIRNYRFTVQTNAGNQSKCDPKEPIIKQLVIEAYDINEALVQFGIKHQDNPNAKVIEVIPFKYIEEQKPAPEQKKEVHVKPLPKHLFPIQGLDSTKLPQVSEIPNPVKVK